jgi:hypothetical protein
MAAGRGRRCVAACVAALSFALAAGDVEAGRGSTIVLSGYETDAIVVSSSGSDTQTIRVDFGPDQPPLPEKSSSTFPRGTRLI